jgi:DNA uptake protein ComE-like DNA-binding protein
MPTPNERKALIFFSAVALLGGVVRVAGAVRDEPVAATAESRAALARQISAVDSARQRAAKKKGVRPVRSRGRVVPAVADDPTDAAPEPVAVRGQALAVTSVRRPVEVLYAGASAVSSGAAAGGRNPIAGPAVPIDMDVATAAELERLPRVGPALARRIVASRDSLGPFGGVAQLRRVRGVGPAVAAGREPYVTFSGRARQSVASAGAADTIRSRQSRGRRSPR